MLAQAKNSRGTDRVTAMLRASMKDGRGTHEIAILDLSPRGILATVSSPPERGDIIVVTVNGQSLAGQVRWRREKRFGVSLRERIDVAAVLSGRAPVARVLPVEPEPVVAAGEGGLQSVLIAYGVLGIAAISLAWLIVSYVL